MTERARRRSTKWDLKEEPNKFSSVTTQNDASFEIESEAIRDNGSKQEWDSSQSTGTRNSKWSDADPSRAFQSEGNTRWSSWESPSRNRADHMDGNVDRDFHEIPKKVSRWDGSRSYNTSISPGHDDWPDRSRSRSPKRGWSKSDRSRSPPHSFRSRSRSPPYGVRSRSRSPPYGVRSRSRSRSRGSPYGGRSRSRSPPFGVRSRSRSPRRSFRSRSRSPSHGPRSGSRRPPHGLNRGPGGGNGQMRGGSRIPPCYDFSKGRCKRGSECKYLHEENDGYEDKRHESRGSYGNPNNVGRDYQRDKFSHGHDQRNNRSSDHCVNFVKGNCHRGSSCRFIHESSVVDGRGMREWTHDRDTVSYPGNDHRRESYRKISIPCRFFAVGNCRNGINCRFSHEGAAHDIQEARPSNDKEAHSLENANNSWGGPKWSDEAADSAHGNVEGWSLNHGSGGTANSTWDNSGWNTKSTWNEGGATDGRPEARSADEKQGNDTSGENRSWGGPKLGAETTDTANGSAEGRSLNDSGGHLINTGWGGPSYQKQILGPTWNDRGTDGRQEGMPADKRQGHHMSDENKSWGGPTWIDEAAVSAVDSVKGKEMNDGKGHLANSGCDDPGWTKQPTDLAWNGDAADSEVKKILQWGSGDNVGQVGDMDENRSLHGTGWSDTATQSQVTETRHWKGRDENAVKTDIPGSQPIQISIDDNTAYSLDDQNKTVGVPTWSYKYPKQDVHQSPQQTSENNSAKLGVQLSRGNEQLLSGPNLLSSGAKIDQYPHFVDHERTRFGIQNPESCSQLDMVSYEQTSSQEVSGQPQPQPHHQQHHQPQPQPQQHHQQQPQQQPQPQLQQHHPVGVMYPEAPKYPASTVMMFPPVSNMNAQSQHMFPFSAPGVRSFDLNGPVEDVPSPNHQTFFQMAETIKEVGNINPKMSPIASGASVPHNIVTSEQVAQISHLSASLAQIFGNSQQLPQLYATLNPTNSMGLAPLQSNSSVVEALVGGSFVQSNQDSWSQKQHDPVSSNLELSQISINPTNSIGLVPLKSNSSVIDASVGGSFVQSNQDSWSQKQHDPVSSGIESSQISIHPPGFSGNPVMQNNMTDHELHISLPSSVPSSLAGGPNGSDPTMNESLEKALHPQSSELKQSVGKERALDCLVKEQDTTLSADANVDGRVDEDGKKSKDTKGMRMFKFALVEFVKEILKPIWKEGTLSKEGHKTVVKKVVDKVTGSVQGDHIPQTQEKIDQYMAYSKTKLTKLVEAYVEKCLKS